MKFMIILIVFSIILPILAGFTKAICDLSEEGNLKFEPKSFWFKSVSWINKWKNDDKNKGEKFFGSSRWFVMLTDAWHLFGYFYNRTSRISGVLLGILAASYNWWFLFGFLLQSIVYSASFHIFHTYKIIRKQ